MQGSRRCWSRHAARWLVVVLALLAAACGTTIYPTSTPAATLTPTPAPRVVSTRLLALLTGQLVMVGQCLRVQSDYTPVLYATSDGGQTWQQVGRAYEGGMSTCAKTSLAFATTQKGWVAGDCSMAEVYLFQRTDDGGRTWQAQALPPPPGEPNLFDLNQIAACRASGPIFTSAQAGVLDIYCHWSKDHLAKRWLYVTTDTGQTWTPRQPPTDLGAAFFVSETTGWWLSTEAGANAGAANLYETADGGVNWTLVKRLGWSGTLDFISPQLGWAVAHAGDAVALVRTVDGGRTWQELKPHTVP